ncbi:MAG: member of Set1p complex, histone methyl transferase [Peltula sp. TS41687]|nr:MAG: member of Set1p complex, histone methyl transferase [Peltula sp. TS41687]
MAGPPPPPPPPPPPQSRPATVLLSDVIHRFSPARVHKIENLDASVTSLDYDDRGELVVAALDDDSVSVYNTKDGTHNKTVYSKKYGCHLARFTHHSSNIIYASTKGDDTIRYLSLHDNQYLRYFAGHTGKVTSLAMNPGNDTFLSCAFDNTARLWSISSPNPTGKLVVHGAYLAAYDSTARVAAIASPATQSIALYDIRHFDKQPIGTFDLADIESVFNPDAAQRYHRPGGQPRFENGYNVHNNPGKWTSLEFTNDGKQLLLGTANGLGHFVIDAYKGHLTALCSLQTPSFQTPFTSTITQAMTPPTAPSTYVRTPPGLRAPPHRSAIPTSASVCLTPDGRYAIGASHGQSVFVWDIQSAQVPEPPPDMTTAEGKLELLSTKSRYILPPSHELEWKAKTEVIAFNNRLSMFNTADKEVVFWTP